MTTEINVKRQSLSYSIAFAAVIGIAGYRFIPHFVGHESSSAEYGDPKNSLPPVSQLSTQVAASRNAAPPESTTENDADLYNMQRELAGMPSPDSAKSLEDREAKLGYFVDEDLQEYRGYSQSTLEDLSASGDLRALKALADNYRTAGYIPMYVQTLERSAVHGSTAILIELGSFHLARLGTPGVDSQERYKKTVEGLAWYSVGQKRGDGLFDMFIQDALKFYKLDIDSETALKVNARAKEIYAALEASRQDLGLGAFDNSVPQEAADFYDLVNHAK